MENFAHNPDVNKEWKPKVAWRTYACAECGTEQKLQTNHTGTVWGTACAGKCKDISNPNTAREHVQWHPRRTHRYVCEAAA